MPRPTRPPLSPDDAIALLHFAFREVIFEPDRILAKRGLGRVHHRILYMCRRNPGLSVGESVRILEVTKQALHRPFADLVTAGLLAVERDPEDARTHRVRLTAKGRTLEARLSGVQRAAFRRALATVGPAGARAWARVMLELARGKTAASLLSGKVPLVHSTRGRST